MVDEVLKQALSFGISGLLFVMWWFERQERVKNNGGIAEALQYSQQVAEVNERLLEVVKANTEALTGLREELRTRQIEVDWLTRIAKAMEKNT
jgi:hypothetical protein